MICPRCSVAEINDDTNACVLCGFTPSTVALEQLVTDEVRETIQTELADRFELQVLLRCGSRSVVYVARDIAHDRLVALKTLPLQGPITPELSQRFQRGVALAAAAQHSHIVPIFEHGVSRTVLWYTMEFIKARPLAEILKESGPFDLQRTVQIVEQVAGALDHLHRRGVIHGNLKPSNVLVDQNGWVRVGDAAVIHSLSQARAAHTAWGSLLSPEYMAPEQFHHRTVGPSADQYALAALAHECLTGSPPFMGDSFDELARKHREEQPARVADLRPDLPAYAADAVQRGLAKTPPERFANVLDFVSMLGGTWMRPAAGALGSAPTGRASSASVVLVPPRVRRSVSMLHVAVATAALAVAAGVYLFTRDSGTPALGPMVTDWIPAPVAPTPPTPAAEQSPPPLAQPEPPAPRVQEPAPRPVRVPAAPQAPARLAINATPWGLVYVDDRLVGNTPITTLTLPAGTYRLRVERDGFNPVERTIQLAAGQEFRITDIVLTPRSP